MQQGNLFTGIPAVFPQEIFETLLEQPGVRLERILSRGQVTPPGQWYDQDGDEWVLLLQGQARLAFSDGSQLTMEPGDWVYIERHRRHRVEYTSAEPAAVWLGLHLRIRNPAATPG